MPADPAVEELYEPQAPAAGFEAAPVQWSASAGDQNAKAAVRRDEAEHHGGAASLRVDYEFTGKKGLEYIQVNGPAEFPAPGLGYGFWIKTDGTPFGLRLRFTDTGGEWHQIDLTGGTGQGWQYVAGTLDSKGVEWGGDGNKRKDYPCKLAGLCIDRPSPGFKGSGVLWIDDAAVARPVKPKPRALKVEALGARFGNVYAAGETVQLRAGAASPGPGRLQWRAADFFGRELARGGGAAPMEEISFKAPRSGWYECRLEWVQEGRVTGAETFACAALPGGAEPARTDYLGVCSHYGQSSYPLETMDLMLRYGIDQFRDEISWGSCEPQKGRLALPSSAEAWLKRAAGLKMRPLLIFDYANRIYDNGGYPSSPEAIEAFARYAVELARWTRGRVQQFEVWNEWVGGCGMDGRPGAHDGEAYGRLLKPVYAAVKREFPDLTVVGIGGEYGSKCAENILGSLRTAGAGSMDAWSIHPYRYPHAPEPSDLTGEVSRIAARVAGAGEKSRAWVTEIGYPTHRGNAGSAEPEQARHVVRTLALLQSTRVVDKVFLYDLKDDGLTRDYNENNFGLIHHQRLNCAPKPAMVAASVFVRLAGTAQFVRLERTGEAWTAFYRQRDGGALVIAWTTRGVCKAVVGGRLAAAFDLMARRFNRPGKWN